MAKAVVIGLAGESDLWLADLDAGTVSRIESGAEEALGTIQTRGSESIVRGVDLAVAVDSGATAFSGQFA